MDSRIDPTVNLSEIMQELTEELFTSMQAIHKRWQKLCILQGMESDELKNERGEVWFFEEEKEFVKQLIREVDLPYLKIIRLDKRFKSIAERAEEAENFKQRMFKSIQNMKDPDLIERATAIINRMCMDEINDLSIEIQENIKLLLEKEMTYSSRVNVLKDINKQIKKYIG